jgi:guanylate kinase
MRNSHGKLFVISSPSGGGKSTVIRAMREMDPGLSYSISATTRPPRNGEVHGEDYYFLSESEFKEKIQNGAFIEWARVHGAYYGTLRDALERSLNEGKTVLLDIDVQGGIQIKSRIPDSVLIFLYPPAFDVLRDRLIKRGTDSPDSIKRRLEVAKSEIEVGNQYDYHVINSNIKETVREVITIINRV